MKRAAILLLLAAMILGTAGCAFAVELIELGSSGRHVKQLQEDLTELQLYDGKISGNAGEKTVAAIRAFQKKYNLTEDGVAGASTYAKIEKVLGRTDSKYGLSGSVSGSGSNAASGSDAVKTVQEGLKKLGLYSGQITGNVGEKTEAAIRAFQQKYGLTVDGKAGGKTLAKLEEVLGGKASSTEQTASSEPKAPAADTKDVMTLQEGLKELGLYYGEITGNIGTKTEAAIRAFQKKNGLTVDGKAGSETLARLKEVLGSKASSSAQSAPAANAEDVMTLQEGLKDLGLYYGEITGNIGTKTEAAIRAFQKKYGLDVDGEAGSSTLARLDEVLGGKASSSDQATPAADAADVMTLQAGLKELGLYYGEITGNIGTKTETAIRAFQKKYGLTEDGKVGSKTLSKLEDVLSGGKTGSASSADVEDVMAVQAGLKELDLYYGDITGNVGTKTEAAIRAFQKKYGLAVDGMVSSGVLDKLDEVLGSAEAEAEAAADVEDVMTMQAGLKALDLYYGEVTGHIGSKTESAIRAFQKKYGLTGDGKVDSKTLGKLDEVLRGDADDADVEDVMTVQAGLKELDLYYGEITGSIGSKTEAAIRAFQKKYGLTVNGKVDAATLSKLDEVLDGKEAEEEALADREDVMTMQEGLKELGLYYADITGNIGTKTEAAIRAFQEKYGLTVSGNVDSKTLSKLEEVLKSDSGEAILDLHWFDEKAYYNSHGVKKGLTITIMDVKTGKQFNARVQSTGYHADVEPQTASDTAIMCEIYGVSKASDISYVRRPVIVKTNVNGRRYTFAGSMYGEAHGSQVVGDNNYDGQFCIHFRHSTTSGSKVEYEMNQTPIDTAVNYAVTRLGMKHVTDVDDAP